MKRTTVFLDETLLQRAKQMARAEGKSLAALVRDAVEGYLAGDRKPVASVPSVAGAFKSKQRDVSESTDSLFRTEPHS